MRCRWYGFDLRMLTSSSFYYLCSLYDRYYASADVVGRRDALQSQWTSLSQKLDARQRRLAAALTAAEAIHKVNLLDNWVADMVALFDANDLAGKDLEDIAILEREHEQRLREVETFSVRAEELFREQESQFASAAAATLSSIRAEHVDLRQRLEALNKSAARRATAIADAKEFCILERDATAVELWIRERIPRATATDLGSSLPAVLHLSGQHASLETDIAAQQKASVEGLAEYGAKLVQRAHPAAASIQVRMESVGRLWQALRAHVQGRRTALDNAVLLQQLRVGANEADSWMAEKAVSARSTDGGRDADGASALLRGHEALTLEVAAFSSVLEGLKRQAAEVRSLSLTRRRSFIALGHQTNNDGDAGAGGSESSEMAVAAFAYEARQPRELSVSKGERLCVIKKKDAKWWKVARETKVSEEGYVPASYLKVLEADPQPQPQAKENDTSASSQTPSLDIDLGKQAKLRIQELDAAYTELNTAVVARRVLLEESLATFAYEHEASRVDLWLADAAAAMNARELGTDPEQVRKQLALFGAFLADMEQHATYLARAEELASAMSASGHKDANGVLFPPSSFGFSICRPSCGGER